MKRLSYCWLFIGLISAVNCYSFDLFDPERGKEKPPEPAKPAPNLFNVQKKAEPEPPPPPPKGPQKDFVLLGTSRIGNNYSAVLQAPDGKTFVQRLVNNKETAIEGYPGYALLSVTTKNVKITYPEDAPCQVSKIPKGVNCTSGGKQARLDLMRKDAIAAPPPPAPVAQQAAANGTDAQNDNPLAAMLSANQRELTPEEKQKREEELERRREIYKNFKRQVIKDEDVPPGMRVVRTPFGDRLVPDNR